MIATSIVQSLRLLDAGVPKESADMMWRNVALTYDFGHAMEIPTVAPILYAFNTKSKDSIPAWSLSALWQMIHEAGVIYEFSTDTGPDELIESLVTIICSHYAPAPSEQ